MVRGAMVRKLMVADCPTGTDAGETLQVASLSPGGEQPRLILPVKPPVAPISAVAVPLWPRVIVSVDGFMVTPKSEIDNVVTALVAEA